MESSSLTFSIHKANLKALKGFMSRYSQKLKKAGMPPIGFSLHKHGELCETHFSFRIQLPENLPKKFKTTLKTLLKNIELLSSTRHRGSDFYSAIPDEIFNVTAEIILRKGFISKNFARGAHIPSTSSLIDRSLLVPSSETEKKNKDRIMNLEFNETTLSVSEKAKEISTLAVTYAQNLIPSSNFERKIKENLSKKWPGDRTLYEMVIVLYMRKMNLIPESEERKPSQKVGSIGEKLVKLLKVIDRAETESSHGYEKQKTFFFTLEDEEGNLYEWSTTTRPKIQVGGAYFINFKIKAHFKTKQSGYINYIKNARLQEFQQLKFPQMA